MWLFCKSGFYSAVQHYDNADVIHIRARFAGDLERLCEKHGLLPVVAETSGNDYPYRMDFSRADWCKIVAKEAEDIDYCNFKNEVHDSTPRDHAYMNCWASLRKFQY